MEREADAAKEQMKAERTAGVKAVPADKAAADGRLVNVVRAVLLAVAVVFIILGVMNGGMRDVLYKAIKICTECVGLG